MKARRSKARRSRRVTDSGGPPCAESQADGVPCDELGQDCDDCEKAEPQTITQTVEERQDDSWAV